MNKIPLLEKFAAQSLVYVDTGLSDGKELIFSKEKFAELIVRECAEFVDYRLTNPDGASMAWCDGSDIKQHFGVEK